MVVVAAYLSLRKVTVFPYIDNWLLVADTQQQLKHDVQLMLRLLAALGLQVSAKKSHLTPLQHLQFTGAVLDSA